MKVTILGAGAYGLALATMVNENSHNITIWTKLDNELEELKKYHTNNRVLPDFVLLVKELNKIHVYLSMMS